MKTTLGILIKLHYIERCIISDVVFSFTEIKSNCGQYKRFFGEKKPNALCSLEGNYHHCTFLITNLK